MTTVNLEQGSQEWLLARCGKVTASRVADITAKTKSGYSASRGNYMAELVCERLTGVPTDTFKSAAMEWGRLKSLTHEQPMRLWGVCLLRRLGLSPPIHSRHRGLP